MEKMAGRDMEMISRSMGVLPILFSRISSIKCTSFGIK